MSATAQFPGVRPGWPAPGPANGFCRAPHFFNERIWRITEPGKVQVGCISLILDQTRGYQRDWALLAPGWFREKLKLESDDTRSVRDALKDAVNRGLIEQRAGGFPQISEYRVNLDAIRTAPDYVARPQPVEDEDPEPTEDAEAPETRYVPESSGVTYHNNPLKQYHAGPLLIAEQPGAATVALCGECATVGIFEMIGAQELSINGANKRRKGAEPQFRPFDVNVRNHSPPPEGPTPPPEDLDKAKFADARHEAVHKYLCKWKPAFERVPSHRQSLEVAKALGEAPIEYLDRVLRQKGYEWFRNEAQHFGVFVPFARDALSAYVYDVGELCPGCQRDGREQRLKPGEICARCLAPEPEATEPEHEDGDWGPVKVALQELLPNTQFDNWVSPTWIGSVSGDALHVRVPNPQTRNELQNEYAADVAAALKAAHGDRYSRVEYEVEVQRE